MSKYKELGPYHYVEFCDESSAYHKHVVDLLKVVKRQLGSMEYVRIHEVGCGEGLIIQQLKNKRFHVTGNDTDEETVRMANALLSIGTVELQGTVEELECTLTGAVPGPLDMVMFSDSLEHIDTWEEHIEWAKRSASYVLIAVPDRHDRHGLRDFHINSFDKIFKDWKCVHRATRHARHLLIFKR